MHSRVNTESRVHVCCLLHGVDSQPALHAFLLRKVCCQLDQEGGTGQRRQAGLTLSEGIVDMRILSMGPEGILGAGRCSPGNDAGTRTVSPDERFLNMLLNHRLLSICPGMTRRVLKPENKS